MSLKISTQGMETLNRELEDLEKKLVEIQIYKNKTAAENGDVWHDNNDFEQSEIEERRLVKSISVLKEKIASAEVITRSSSQEDVVGFGAIVELKLTGSDFHDQFTIHFDDSDEKSDYQKVSINSPMGKTIFNQKVGFVGKYSVNKHSFTVEILKISY